MKEISLLVDFLARGGWVMYPLLGLSVLALGIVLERGFLIAAAARANNRALRDPDKAMEDSPLARVLAAYRRHHGDPNWVRKVNYAGSRELHGLERRLGWLPILAEVSTLTGLFGTVLGMVEVFRSIELGAGAPDASLLAAGIWQALVTTIAGLAIAIPAILCYHYLLNRVDDIGRLFREEIERFAEPESGGASDKA